ncbi:ras-related protein Rab-7L1-like [Anguilla rostrata]|uniref:ras-related protein Rab-7L1-like n=1 Tax=Anguilla rostrata TaxID=7938 RepID=UPI0030D4DB41
MPSDHLFKILVIGRSKVGKTSFVQHYVNGVFSEGYKTTIGVDFAMKTIEWSSEQTMRLQFWDIEVSSHLSGQEDTLPFTRAFYKDAHACIIMFDLTSQKSFQYSTLLKKTVDDVILSGNGLPIPCILLGNKSDLTEHAVSSQEIEDTSRLLQFIAWKEISVKENIHIEETVRCIVEALMEKQQPDEILERARPKDEILENQLETKLNRNTQQSSCCGAGVKRNAF